MLPSPKFTFQPHTFVFIDLNGTADAKLKYPAALAFIESVQDDEICIYWFADPLFKNKNCRDHTLAPVGSFLV